MSTIKTETTAVKDVLSHARLSTYEKATTKSSAIELYVWNAHVSGAMLLPLHICEVSIRNGISDMLTKVYGPKWAWSTGFEKSLPASHANYYSQLADLIGARKNKTSIGNVIPDLKFVFWQKMFTSKHDARLWNTYLYDIFPNVVRCKKVAQLREEIYNDLELIRGLRNRIAHHEPIFSRDILHDYEVIKRVIGLRCEMTANWLENNQKLSEFIHNKPV